jgi:hypothetical protein
LIISSLQLTKLREKKVIIKPIEMEEEWKKNARRKEARIASSFMDFEIGKFPRKTFLREKLC